MSNELTPADRALAAVEVQLEELPTPLSVAAETAAAAAAAAADNSPDDYNNSSATNLMDFYTSTLNSTSRMAGNNNNNTGSSPRRTTPLFQRSATPIMSNSSSKRDLRKDVIDDNDDDDDDDDDPMDTVPAPVETPMPHRYQRTFQPASLFVRKPPFASLITSNRPSSSSLNQASFRRYHEATSALLYAKRSLDARIELDLKEQQRTGQTTALPSAMTSGLGATSLADQQMKVEVEFCKELSLFCYSISTPTSTTSTTNNKHGGEAQVQEGHVWKLLAYLRTLGLDALIWPDDSGSATQNDTAIDMDLRRIVSHVRATPKQVLYGLLTSRCTALQRKHRLVQWIQSCMEQESKPTKTSLPTGTSSVLKLSGKTHFDDRMMLSPMDAKLLKLLMPTCLCEILEGNVEKACDLASSYGYAIGAALWVGGEPYGYEEVADHDTGTVQKTLIGNPERFLWKRMIRYAGRELLEQCKQQQDFNSSSTSATLAEEAAIYSILSNDVVAALENPCIKTSWIKSLGVLLTGVWERVVDEALHQHNNTRRRSPPLPYLGTQYEEQEHEQLLDTKDLARMKESQIVTVLDSNPFLQPRQEELVEGYTIDRRVSYKSVMLAFIVGKSAIARFCEDGVWRFLQELGRNRNTSDDLDWAGLRFLTHLLLFLDSFDVSTSRVPVQGLTMYKNQILFEYVKYLESRPDLGRMLTLYVSLLPEVKILEYYPPVLARVLNPEERIELIKQIRDYMPTLELPLLRQVVRTVLGTTPSLGEKDENLLDRIKCDSFQWLLQHDEHLEDALICANIFMRELLLAEDKMELAMHFIDNDLPSDLVARVKELHEDACYNNDDTGFVEKVESALFEHHAYVHYLEAYRTFDTFKDSLNFSVTENATIPTVNKTNLNPAESEVMDRASQRNWIREKKQLFEKVVGAAEECRAALFKVLTHPGGWLSVDGSDSVMSLVDNNEERRRRNEMNAIRSRHMVLAVSLYHQVCEETAMWISRNFDEGGSVGLSREKVLPFLDSDLSSSDKDPTVSNFSTNYWYQHAKDLSTIVASDNYGIYTVFTPGELMDLLTKIAETAVSELLNQSSK
jgi:hypothetical protein